MLAGLRAIEGWPCWAGGEGGYKVLKITQFPAVLELAPLRSVLLRPGAAAARPLRPGGPWGVPGLQCGSQRAHVRITAGEDQVEVSLSS